MLSALWLLAIVVLTYLFGFIVAVAIYIPIFLWRVANARWRTLVFYPIIVVAVLLALQRFADVALPNGYIYLGI